MQYATFLQFKIRKNWCLKSTLSQQKRDEKLCLHLDFKMHFLNIAITSSFSYQIPVLIAKSKMFPSLRFQHISLHESGHPSGEKHKVTQGQRSPLIYVLSPSPLIYCLSRSAQCAMRCFSIQPRDKSMIAQVMWQRGIDLNFIPASEGTAPLIPRVTQSYRPGTSLGWGPNTVEVRRKCFLSW